MKICICWLYAISKYGYPPLIENTLKVIEEMADLGFNAVELEAVGEKNLREIDENKGKILEICESRGLRIVNFVPIFRELVSFDKLSRRKAFKCFEKSVELASFFDPETVQTDSYTPPIEFVGETPYKEALSFGKPFKVEIVPAFKWGKFWKLLVNTFIKCNEISERAGFKFCLEPRVGESISNTDALLRLMDAVGSKNFGAVLDTGHLHAQKEILPLSVEKLGKRIFYLHVSDNDGRDNYHLGLGKGTIDWVGVFKALDKVNFKGYVGIDIGHIPDLDREVVESKGYLERLMAN